jgi:hypothetical protein
LEVKDVKLNLWDKFVESSPQGTIFSSSKWLTLYDASFKVWGVYKNGNLIGGAANFDSPQPITQSQGILIAPFEGKPVNKESLEHEVTNALIDYLPSHFACHYEFKDVRPLLWGGFKASPKYTYVVKPDWDNLEKETRYEIKNAEINVEVSQDIDWFDELYAYTFGHKRITRTASTELIKKVFSIGTLYKASDNSAGVILLKDNKRYYYILGASSGKNTSAKVLWEAIKDKEEVDLIGCNNEKIAMYKKGFGGELRNYHEISKLL